MSSSILIVSDRLPSTSGAGAESVLSALCSVTACLGDRVDFLVSEGALIKVSFERLAPPSHDHLTFFRAAQPVRAADAIAALNVATKEPAALRPSAYRKVFVFGDSNIIELSRFTGHKVAWPDDPPYLVSAFKAGCSLLPLRSRARALASGLSERWQHRKLNRALAAYELIVHHANHHATDFGKAVPTPIIYAPPLIPSMREASGAANAAPGVCRSGFIHVGHLGGAASLAAVEVLLSQPVRQHFRAAAVDPLTLVGKADIPGRIKDSLVDCGYRLTGFVDDLDQAMFSCRAVVVPGNYFVGARTRILHALSLGTPVVAHASCLAGTPELKQCPAVELFDSDTGLVSALTRMETLDPAGLHELSLAALCFMRAFAPTVEQKWRAVFE